MTPAFFGGTGNVGDIWPTGQRMRSVSRVPEADDALVPRTLPYGAEAAAAGYQACRRKRDGSSEIFACSIGAVTSRSAMLGGYSTIWLAWSPPGDARGGRQQYEVKHAMAAAARHAQASLGSLTSAGAVCSTSAKAPSREGRPWPRFLGH